MCSSDLFPSHDTWVEKRNARNYKGNDTIIAHPPCRLWGRLAHMAKAPEEEKELAILSINLARSNGGIVEHPAHSKLWTLLKLPIGNETDEWGGYTISINQHWFGHRAEKRTFLYICGIERKKLPKMPLNFNAIEYTISTSGNKKEVTKYERSATPIQLAKWLIETANRIETLKKIK